jgi:hypothetical protein
MLVNTNCHLRLLDFPPEQVVAEALDEGSGTWSTSGVELVPARLLKCQNTSATDH